MVCPPLRWWCVQGMCSTQLLLPTPRFCSRFFKSGSCVFVVSVSFVQNLSQLPCTQFFLVPRGFFVFCCSRRCVSRCKHCSTAANGPRSQLVSPAALSLAEKQSTAGHWACPPARLGEAVAPKGWHRGQGAQGRWPWESSWEAQS